MNIPYKKLILTRSELRTNLEKVRRRIKKTPVIITNNGRPDFGICDLETLAIAAKIKDLKDLLNRRTKQKHVVVKAETVFKQFDKKYNCRNRY